MFLTERASIRYALLCLDSFCRATVRCAHDEPVRVRPSFAADDDDIKASQLKSQLLILVHRARDKSLIDTGNR